MVDIDNVKDDFSEHSTDKILELLGCWALEILQTGAKIMFSHFAV